MEINERSLNIPDIVERKTTAAKKPAEKKTTAAKKPAAKKTAAKKAEDK